jgi:molybdate transport system substrate-binding protein
VVLDETAHTPVRIMAGVLRAAPSAEQAAAFMGFLESPQARAVITANGL